MFIHTGGTQSQASAHEQCVCRGDSMLRKRPAAGVATTVHPLPSSHPRGKEESFFFLPLNVPYFSAPGISNITTNNNSNNERASQTDVTVSPYAGSTGCTQVTYWPFTTQRDWTFIPRRLQTVQCGPVAEARGGAGGGVGRGRPLSSEDFATFI